MGMFAGLLKEDGAEIPEDKREEFEQRVEKLFQAGGMMEMENIQLSGRRVAVIKKAAMHEYGMDFYYNYFDDDIWENAGFNKERCQIYSEKVGGYNFLGVILAAYTLEALYLDYPAIATVDRELVAPQKYADWIYYLFHDDSLFYKTYRYILFSAEPYSTEKFLKVSHDDMILYWEEGGDIKFSDDLKNWFKELKKRFDQIMAEDAIDNKGLVWILDTMDYAHRNYVHIYAIADFFEETLGHLDDHRYHALWKMYEEMLHDPELKEAGSVIFSPDDPEDEDGGVHFSKNGLIRPLKGSWSFMKRDEKNNKARVTFERYMALVANKELRKKVFGF